MASEARTIVVCGATGKQGGAVVNSVLAAGAWNVVAIARNPESSPAQALRERGVEVRQADLLDGPSLTRAFEGAYGVFGVTTPLTPKGKIDTEQERRHGFNIADACVATGVQHLVLSAVLYINDAQRAVPYVQSKQIVEEYVSATGTPFTFLCPASFMDEIGGEFLPVKKDVITGQADGDAKVPYIACRDIGEFARLASAANSKRGAGSRTQRPCCKRWRKAVGYCPRCSRSRNTCALRDTISLPPDGVADRVRWRLIAAS